MFQKSKSRTQNMKVHYGKEYLKFKNVLWKFKFRKQNLKIAFYIIIFRI